jgi:hypothetical protein
MEGGNPFFFGYKLLSFISFFLFLYFGLALVDLFFFDRVSNSYLNHSLNHQNDSIIVIGSSRTKWSTIDSLMPKATFLAEGGQYAYGSLGVLSKLKNSGKLNNTYVFIDLVDSDEIVNGNGQWWYFSEIFLYERLASLQDYSVTDWPKIFSRITKDIFHFSPNQYSVFQWRALDSIRTPHPDEPVREVVNDLKSKFENCDGTSSLSYINLLKRFSVLVNLLNIKYNCRIYIILPPYPSMCKKQYAEIFGEEKIIDLSLSVDYEISDFYDNTHLNQKGALKFTQKFAEMIVEKLSDSNK